LHPKSQKDKEGLLVAEAPYHDRETLENLEFGVMFWDLPLGFISSDAAQRGKN